MIILRHPVDALTSVRYLIIRFCDGSRFGNMDDCIPSVSVMGPRTLNLFYKSKMTVTDVIPTASRPAEAIIGG